ncbi:serine/threonine-protein kinase [Nesterenkonia lacusekhoensis]|uniref:non-specific serine/threonine protein kinase n=1 Tax=Nesterenkonia lacusekhoensis TaxID=150832 RepID=A0ABS4T4L8_9MICC|nr:serine/threonine-protein kinase [Nesterenkonia lacusekhoensis]MBP2319407.1 serine/threonine protein kinase [Nesterenkonia lacusekhoensis]
MQAGRYQLQEVIGVGSFATVHRARDEHLDDTVVVKILAENHSLNPEIRERFIAEGRSLRRVSSPHVVSVHDIGESDRQQPYLVLAHADRGTLAQRVTELRRRGWRPRREDLLAVARPLAAAVAAVHRAQLVHRDLSPGNVLLASAPAQEEPQQTQEAEPLASALVSPDERLLLADLGMCKDLAMNSGLTVSGGTSGFRPPEQQGTGLVDFRADIWAMSAVLRWVGEEADLPPEMDRALRRVLKRGLQTDPRRRYPDVAAWLAEVEQALALPVPPGHYPPSVTPRSGDHIHSADPEKTEGPRRRASPWKRGLAMVGVVLLAAALGLLGGYLLRGSEQDVPSSSADVSVAIDGPEEVAVGEPATFTAQVEGVDSWVWVLPTGGHLADEEEAVLTPTSPGTAEVVLRTHTPEGAELEASHTIDVTEE